MTELVYYQSRLINLVYAIQTKVMIITCVQNAKKVSGDGKVSNLKSFNLLFFRHLHLLQVPDNAFLQDNVVCICRYLCMCPDSNHSHILKKL